MLLFISLGATAQNPDGFDKMVKSKLRGTVQQVSPTQLFILLQKNPKATILDTRSTNEYNVSHLKNAKLIDYDNFSLDQVAGLDKNEKIFVYCSIGVRSENIGDKLKKAGFTKVYNLFGGIFNWANNGHEIVDSSGKKTTKVHGYNTIWGKWINTSKCQKVVD